jgi:hypothetical protein
MESLQLFGAVEDQGNSHRYTVCTVATVNLFIFGQIESQETMRFLSGSVRLGFT